MAKLPLSIALGEYDHTRDVVSGAVAIEGVEPRFLSLSIEEITTRYMRHREFEVCELSFGNYCTLLNAAQPEAVAIPVFTSRVFRHSAIYVRGDSALRSIAELGGQRIGIPQWSQTATIYVRGLLPRHGVALDGIDWVQAGVVEPGRAETASLALPPGIRLTERPDRSLTHMLIEGEIDAVISARPPDGRGDGPRHIRPLLADAYGHEVAFWKETGIFPIMHLLVLDRAVYESNRWIARSLLNAFTAAKQRSLHRLDSLKASYLPVGWGREQATATNRLLFGDGEPWPYGVHANRRTIEAFLAYCREQGLLNRDIRAEDIFAPESLAETRV